MASNQAPPSNPSLVHHPSAPAQASSTTQPHPPIEGVHSQQQSQQQPQQQFSSSPQQSLQQHAPNPISIKQEPTNVVTQPHQQPVHQQAVASAPTAQPAQAHRSDAGASQQQQALQQQIQQQLQQQLKAQLEAAAAKGQQAIITPEQIQAQAQAMVQAAAQAQAVVQAAKNRGDGSLVPMNAQQIAALSRIQAQAIVNARPSTALIAVVGQEAKGGAPTPNQIEAQIQLQTQALIHAHTQAQIAANIYKGDTTAAEEVQEQPAKKPKIAPSPTPQSQANAPTSLTVPQMRQQNELTQRQTTLRNDLLKTQRSQVSELRSSFSQNNSKEMNSMQELQTKHAHEQREQQLHFQKEMQDLQARFRLENNDEVALSTLQQNHEMEEISTIDTPQFKSALQQSLSQFWSKQMNEMIQLPIGDEQDFKNHNDLPLARIKRIMKSDEDVRMISAEAPVLFAKACEMFILELTLRSWAYSESNKRRTLQKEDIQLAIQRTDIFDFLVDVIH